VMVASAAFGLIAYFAGNALFATYLGINHVPQTGELAVVAGAVIGDGVVVGPRNELTSGIRIWPGTNLGETSIRFSSDA